MFSEQVLIQMVYIPTAPIFALGQVNDYVALLQAVVLFTLLTEEVAVF